MNLPTLSMWIDSAPKEVLAAPLWVALSDLRVTCAAVMVETGAHGFDPKYSPKDLARIGELALEHQIELALTVWPQPTKEWFAAADAQIDRMLEASRACELEADGEGNWTPAELKGFASMALADRECVRFLKRPHGRVRRSWTTYPLHRENGRTAAVAAFCDRIYPQGYSVRNRAKPLGTVEWDSVYGPGGMQKLAAQRARTLKNMGTPTGPKLCMGLAAYDQRWPGRSVSTALETAWDAAVAEEVHDLRMWSSKWVLGTRGHGPVVREFLMSRSYAARAAGISTKTGVVNAR